MPHIHSKKVHVEAADRPDISSDPSPIQRSVPSPTERRAEDVQQPARRMEGQPVAVYLCLNPYLHTAVRPTSPHDPHLKQQQLASTLVKKTERREDSWADTSCCHLRADPQRDNPDI